MNNERVTKTPVTLLQEICAKKGLQVEYILVSSCGPDHRPEFTYNIKAGHLTAAASGLKHVLKNVNEVIFFIFFCLLRETSFTYKNQNIHNRNQQKAS